MRATRSACTNLLPARLFILCLTAILALALGSAAWAQQPPQTSASTTMTAQPLITQPIDETNLTTLKGNTHPLARQEFDLGTAPASLPMDRMLLVLKRSDAQEFALRKLLDDQQDKSSPNYHNWLKPEQFGQQFGPTDADLQIITQWLQSHGFQVGTTKGRTVLEFSGSASQVAEAFHTSIHKYVANGEQHWANATDPQIPTALVPAVAGVLTLHNFIKKPALHFTGEKIPAKLVPGKKPQVTFPPQNGGSATNALSPQDYATIYNINPVYNTGIYGTGVFIGVVGRSNLYNGGSDIQDFLSVFPACCGTFGVILNGPDPGDLGGDEEAEATLDSSWTKAIGQGASTSLVVSATTNSTDGIDLSEVFLIEGNNYDIMTESFSSCELYATDAQLAGQSALAEQAAAQGITYIVSTGDDGAEGCDYAANAPATNPISVNSLASTAFTVAVGGTMFNENGNVSQYWTSAPPFQETAISYIPENVWNESSLANGLWSSSGGASAGNIQSGSGTTSGVPKPSWQYGVMGIPTDGVRDLPDISLTAAGHDPYLLCLEGSCVPNSNGEVFVYFISGTSASAPSFAGIMALVDQRMGVQQGQERLGLANYVLYRLAATESAYPSQCNGSNTASAPASTCIFNDVTVGNNVVPGEVGTDYQASAGYDLTTGLGSVNVANLVNNWNSVTFNPSTTTLTLNSGNAVTITHGQSVPLTINVAPNSGTGIPTGDTTLETGNGIAPSILQFFPLTGGQAISSTSQLPGNLTGAYSVWAQYGGDSTFAPSSSSLVSVTVNPEPSVTDLSVLTADQNGNPIPFTGGPFGSFVYLRADVRGQSGYGIATGSVTFSDNGSPLASGSSLPLNSQGNTATPNGIFNFDTGSHSITASYTGDPSFSGSTSTPAVNFTITPGFYVAIPTAQSTVTVSAPGGTGQTSLTISNSTNFSGTISLSCSGLPSEATCAFSPASITANGTAGTIPASVTVTTTAATTAEQSHRRIYTPAVWIVGAGVAISFAGVGGKQQRGRAMFLLLMMAMLVVAPSCGGGNNGGRTPPPPPPNPGTPAGSYTIVVTATSGSTTSNTAFLLVLQ